MFSRKQPKNPLPTVSRKGKQNHWHMPYSHAQKKAGKATHCSLKCRVEAWILSYSHICRRNCLRLYWSLCSPRFFVTVYSSKVYHRHFAMSIYQMQIHIIFLFCAVIFQKNFRKHASFVDFICDCGIIILIGYCSLYAFLQNNYANPSNGGSFVL